MMAIAFLWDFPGLSEDQYHAGMAQFQPDGRLVPGQLFHAAGPNDGGWWVYHVWESHPPHDAVLREKPEQIMQDAGLPPPRSTRTFQVGHVLT